MVTHQDICLVLFGTLIAPWCGDLWLLGYIYRRCFHNLLQNFTSKYRATTPAIVAAIRLLMAIFLRSIAHRLDDFHIFLLAAKDLYV